MTPDPGDGIRRGRLHVGNRTYLVHASREDGGKLWLDADQDQDLGDEKP